jgi:hypothetical protein
MDDPLVYLDTYVLQQDMRIRLPKSILANIPAERGVTRFAIFMDARKHQLLLKVSEDSTEEKR